MKQACCYSEIFGLFPQQKQTDLSSVLVTEDSEVNAAAAAGAATQDNVTEEVIGSPLAMWELEIQNIELEKGEGGLGFSILDYQVGLKGSKRISTLANLIVLNLTPK